MNVRVILAAVLLAGAVPVARVLAQAPDAKSLYEDNCRKCHGVRGVPPKTMKEKFAKIATFDSAFVSTHSTDSIVKVLTKGKNEDMKSFKEKLTAEQMADVAKYVHSLSQKAKP